LSRLIFSFIRRFGYICFYSCFVVSSHHRPMRLRTLDPPPRPRLDRPPRLRPPLDPRERRPSAGKSSAEFSREIVAESCPPTSPSRLFARRSPASSLRPSFASSSRSRLRPPLGLESTRSLDLSRLRLFLHTFPLSHYLGALTGDLGCFPLDYRP